MQQIKVYRLSDGAPAIKCPRCDELVSPAKNDLFGGHDCPDCLGTIDSDDLRSYTRAVKIYSEGGAE